MQHEFVLGTGSHIEEYPAVVWVFCVKYVILGLVMPWTQCNLDIPSVLNLIRKNLVLAVRVLEESLHKTALQSEICVFLIRYLIHVKRTCLCISRHINQMQFLVINKQF